MTTATGHEWLRRLSDYHSGDVSDAEHAAIESHLQTCVECQEALAMYRRFYSLLRSPLRLGGPGATFAEEPPTLVTLTPLSPHGQPPYRQPRPRRKLVAGIAAGLAAALVVAGFLAALAARGSGPSVAATPPIPRHTATTAPQPTSTASATPGATATPAPSAFVCANPAGSQMVYAYVRGDGNLYVVEGCSQPRQIVTDTSYPRPLAWSPSNRYLMVDSYLPNGDDQVVAFDNVTGQRYPTSFSQFYSPNLEPGDTAHLFIGWLSDQSFLGVNVPITQQENSGAPIGPMTVVKVDLFDGKQTAVTKITWAATFAVRDNGKYLYYGGFQSASEGGAYLHRMDLTTATDTKLVPLGLAGPGGCQGTPVCPWTAPWDVTADGVHVLYHNPGPANSPSDTYIPPDTPLFYANVDGSGATKPFGSKLATGSTEPLFSPDGRYVVATGSNYTPGQPALQQTDLAQVSGGGSHIVDGYLEAWRADSQATVLETDNGDILYTVSDGATHPLEAHADSYVWGN